MKFKYISLGRLNQYLSNYYTADIKKHFVQADRVIRVIQFPAEIIRSFIRLFINIPHINLFFVACYVLKEFKII